MNPLLRRWRYGSRGLREITRWEGNWQSVLEINRQLAALVSEHHAVGALDDALVGDRCHICIAAGVNHASLSVRIKERA